MEFSWGGKPRRLASSSAKSSSLAVSSQQNCADTVALPKPTSGSAIWGGPNHKSLLQAFLVSPGFGSIILWAPPTTWSACTWRTSPDPLTGIRRGTEGISWGKGHTFSLHSSVMQGDRGFFFCFLFFFPLWVSSVDQKAMHHSTLFRQTRVLLAFSKPQNLKRTKYHRLTKVQQFLSGSLRELKWAYAYLSNVHIHPSSIKLIMLTVTSAVLVSCRRNNRN